MDLQIQALDIPPEQNNFVLRLGEQARLEFLVYSDRGRDVSSNVTATVEIYDSAGAATLAAAAMTAESFSDMTKLTYNLWTGTGNTITTAGDYRLTVRAADKSDTPYRYKERQYALQVLARPS